MENKGRNPNENDRSNESLRGEKKKGKKSSQKKLCKDGKKYENDIEPNTPRQPIVEQEPDIIKMTRHEANREDGTEQAASSEQDEGHLNRCVEVAVLRLVDMKSQVSRRSNAAEAEDMKQEEELKYPPSSEDEFPKKFQ